MKIINMINLIKIFTLLAIFFISNPSFSQINMEKYAGKRYNALYKQVIKDSNFIDCRLLTSATNKANGVELFFKKDIHYTVSFKKSKLNDSYSCESGPVRAMKIYVIHYYKGEEYQEGYCKCSSGESTKLIDPNFQK